MTEQIRSFQVGDRVRIKRSSGYYDSQPEQRQGPDSGRHMPDTVGVVESLGLRGNVFNVYWSELNYRNRYDFNDLELVGAGETSRVPPEDVRYALVWDTDAKVGRCYPIKYRPEYPESWHIENLMDEEHLDGENIIMFILTQAELQTMFTNVLGSLEHIARGGQAIELAVE